MLTRNIRLFRYYRNMYENKTCDDAVYNVSPRTQNDQIMLLSDNVQLQRNNIYMSSHIINFKNL